MSASSAVKKPGLAGLRRPNAPYRTLVTLVSTKEEGKIVKLLVKDTEGKEFTIMPRKKENGEFDKFDADLPPGSTFYFQNLSDAGNGEKTYSWVDRVNTHPGVWTDFKAPLISFRRMDIPASETKPARTVGQLTISDKEKGISIGKGASVEQIKAAIVEALQATKSLAPENDKLFDPARAGIIISWSSVKDGKAESSSRNVGVVKNEDGTYRPRTIDEFVAEVVEGEFVQVLEGAAADLEDGVSLKVFPSISVSAGSLTMYDSEDWQEMTGDNGRVKGAAASFKVREGVKKGGDKYLVYGALEGVHLSVSPFADGDKLKAILVANGQEPSLFKAPNGSFSGTKALDYLTKKGIDVSDAIRVGGNVSSFTFLRKPEPVPMAFALAGIKYDPAAVKEREAEAGNENSTLVNDSDAAEAQAQAEADATLAAQIDEAANAAVNEALNM